MHIAPLYASLLALLFIALSVRTVRIRRRLQIGIGDAGNETMLRAMRVHSNFAEYVPLGLLMLFFVELSGANGMLVHALGLCLLAGRLIHAFGVSQGKENYNFRVSGMTLTFVCLLTSAIFLLYMYAGRAVT